MTKLCLLRPQFRTSNCHFCYVSLANMSSWPHPASEGLGTVLCPSQGQAAEGGREVSGAIPAAASMLQTQVPRAEPRSTQASRVSGGVPRSSRHFALSIR